MSDDRLLTIGEFSRLSRVSVRMLRHYDEHGVLQPTRVDPFSGYRFYAPALLRTAGRVRALRDAGLGVADLAACAPFTEAALLRRVLLERRAAAQAEIAAVRSRVADIDRFIDELEVPAMSTTITRTTRPSRTVASVRDVLPTFGDEGLLWQRLGAGLAAAGAAPAPDGEAVAVFHDPEYIEHDVDVEVQLDVVAPFDSTDAVRCVEVPPADIAVGELHGSYDGMPAVMADLGAWLAEQGLRESGPMFNVYVAGPMENPDPTAWVTRVCLPVTSV
ncbi:MAG: MerR family transcriptional regulator [Cellulomonas sp.]|nr:MerR family transcriptional regulator [Cellulomonas sp.]